MKTKKQALLHSIVSLILCITMLVGTTFAWFTDSVISGINMIAAGNLDVELYHSNAAVTDERVDSATELFKDLNGNDILWEPGVVSYENLRITNEGDLALTWQMTIATANENFVVDGEDRYGLSQILKVGVVEGGITATDRQSVVDSVADADWTTLADLVRSGSLPESGSSETWGIVIYWQPGDNDNLWNLNNGKQITSGDTLQIDLGIKLVATQEVYESDSFGNDYDTDAGAFIFHDFVGGTASTNVTPENGVTTGDVTMNANNISATVPAGVKVTGETLTFSVTQMTTSGANITLNENEDMLSLDVHIDGVADGNTTPITVVLEKAAPVGLNMGNYKLYHVENGSTVEMTLVDTFTAHNQFKYDPATGDITLYMATFSEVSCVIDSLNAWNGEFDYDWYDANATALIISSADQLAAFGKIVGGMADEIDQDSFSGKTISLIADINLGDKENANDGLIFHPIGYSCVDGDSTVNAFSGTFDGQGHTIGNFYQNTWEIEGDYDNGYYKDAMGLFGYVSGGTVKNLTVDHFSSDGEFTPTGVIAAFVDGESTFQNIAITNCNPRVYNTGNGGIIGVAGNSSGGDNITLSNITVDNSNKISALWGSWDVACGGLVGMFRGNDNGSKISFTNCHVAAQIDVYNDVCANYQYYAYRYAGMIIGSVRNNTTNDEGKSIPNMTGISASGCTVNYGDWNDYYYCELVDNTTASYTHDYQMSRLTKVDVLPDTATGTAHYYVENSDRTITCRHFIDGVLHTHDNAGTEMLNGETVAVEDKTCVYLPFVNQLFTGYSWGVSSVGIDKWQGFTELGITEGEQEESVTKFESKFTGDFLYRVGNLNEIKLGSLFAEIDEDKVNDSGVYVRIDKLYDDADVTCTFTANETDWTQGTLKFEGTGVVDIVIQDYDFCTPTTLHLEVVEAVNATTATNATANNVVLLNDCGFSSLEVSDGYALYGNGFTMTCSTDSYAKDFGYAFVTLENGTLDNVQIVCPNFDHAALYKSNLTSSNNRSNTDTSGTVRYYNARSSVMVSGNSQILNSRISGARAAVNVSGGNCVIDNSRIELGAVASVLVGAANSLTLRDVTLVQKPTASTYDSSKTLMGFSMLVMATSGGDAAPITLEGTLTQNAWVDENDKQYVPEDAQTIIDTVMGEEEYLHDIDGDGTNESLNLGIAYMPADGEYTVNTPSITDNRTNKDTIPYDSVEVKYSLMTTYVYSYKNTNGTDDSTKVEGEYTPGTQSDIITVIYSDTADGLTTGKSYGTDGWVYELNVDLDTLSGYELDFSKLSMSVNGVNVTDFKVNGSDKPTTPVTVTAGGTTYILTATVNGQEYNATYKVTGTETSKESPSLVASDYGTGVCVSTKNSGTWHGAAPVLEGIQIKYWSVAEQQYKTITLSEYTPSTAGQQNGTNNYWTYTPDNEDFTLTIKNETAVHSSNSVYAMPVVCDSKLYFVASSSNGLVNSGNSARKIEITYYFNDNNNGEQLKFSNTWSVEEKSEGAYNYSEFCNGTLKTNECITPDTLITLADGTQVRVDSLTGSEELLVWNLETGKYDTAPIVFVDSENETEFEIIHLYFSDGSDVKVISEHGFFDLDLGEYVYIDAANYAEYIGHRFVAQGEIASDNWNIVTLDKVALETEVTTAWSPVTFEHLCYYTNGVLSMPGGIEGLFNIFEVDTAAMRYDAEKMQKDIETYGLFTLDDFGGLITEEAFRAFNGAYLKVAMGKGLLTWEDIAYMAERYIPLM